MIFLINSSKNKLFNGTYSLVSMVNIQAVLMDLGICKTYTSQKGFCDALQFNLPALIMAQHDIMA